MAARDVMAEWAQLYASQGWQVFPLHVPLSAGTKEGPQRATCSCGSSTCTSQGKHPRTAKGLHDATTDADTIAAWWERWPASNIGLRTGVVFDVLDLDGPMAAELLRRAVAHDATADVVGPTVGTGQGVHRYYRATGHTNRASLGATGSGIDWRGVGGYVVAPPSLHYSGRTYHWLDGADHTDKLPDAPDWLVHLVATRTPVADSVLGRQLRKVRPAQPTPPARVSVRTTTGTSPYGRAVLERAAGMMATATVGQRNITLNSAAMMVGHYVGGGEIVEADAIAVLVSGAVAMGLSCAQDDKHTEGWLTIVSGLSAGIATPQCAPTEPRHTAKGVQR